MPNENENHSGIKELDSRVDSVAERVAKIEGTLFKQSEKSLIKKISEYGGLAALAISIAIGVFTLYDKAIKSPRDSTYNSERELRNSLSQLSEISTRIGELDWENNPVGSEAKARSYSARRNALLEDVLLSRKSHPEVFKFHDFVLLAHELEYFERRVEAIEELNHALELANNDYEKASIISQIGRDKGMIGELESMNELFEESAKLFKNVDAFRTPSDITILYISWIEGLLMHGLCKESEETAREFVDELIEINFSAPTLTATKRGYGNMLEYVPTNCSIEELEKIMDTI